MSWLVRKVEWNGCHDNLWQRPECASQPPRGLVVQDTVDAVPYDDLGKDYGDGEIGALGVERFDVVDHWCDDRAVARDDDLERRAPSSAPWFRAAGGPTRPPTGSRT